MNTKNFKDVLQNKRSGFYVGAAGALLALVTMFIYISMNSKFFSGLVVLGLILGIVAFAVAGLFNLNFLYVLSYASYMFAFYHFMVLEVEQRMDVLVDPGQGFFSLDALFYVATILFLACIIVTLVASCMKQEKE
ncbi:MAG: hypothetical protein J6D37_02480 [Clostridia bacterium]|nr:hypothetical protein [Clostridia bacterium]